MKRRSVISHVEVSDLNAPYSISVVTDVLIQLSEEVKRHHAQSVSPLRKNGTSGEALLAAVRGLKVGGP
ncbi:MAG: hypothetical protein WAO20_14640 [Acidobacteriota bacterium]|jgi:hypothetical protein